MTDVAEAWAKNLERLHARAFGEISDEATTNQTMLNYWTAQARAGYPGASENVKYYESLISSKCKYCHEDGEGYSTQFGGFWVAYSPRDGWQLHGGKLKPKSIKYCPICGRRLRDELRERS